MLGTAAPGTGCPSPHKSGTRADLIVDAPPAPGTPVARPPFGKGPARDGACMAGPGPPSVGGGGNAPSAAGKDVPASGPGDPGAKADSTEPDGETIANAAVAPADASAPEAPTGGDTAANNAPCGAGKGADLRPGKSPPCGAATARPAPAGGTKGASGHAFRAVKGPEIGTSFPPGAGSGIGRGCSCPAATRSGASGTNPAKPAGSRLANGACGGWSHRDAVAAGPGATGTDMAGATGVSWAASSMLSARSSPLSCTGGPLVPGGDDGAMTAAVGRPDCACGSGDKAFCRGTDTSPKGAATGFAARTGT